MVKERQKSPVERIQRVMANRPLYPVPKGEVWLGTDLLKQAGYADTLENHLLLAKELGQDMVCLPVTDDRGKPPTMGYRYFHCTELEQAVQAGNLFVMAVIDGPFQELVTQRGLMELLTGWFRNQEEIMTAYGREKEKILELITCSMAQGIHGVVITDDWAGDQGPLISPADIGRLCSPFYSQAVKEIHQAKGYAFLHACGKIAPMINLIKAWDFDGLAAVQHRANNLVALGRALGPGRVIMAGIDAHLLGSDSSQAALIEFQCLFKDLASKGGFILSSSCGLYEGEFLGRIKKIYALADDRAEL